MSLRDRLARVQRLLMLSAGLGALLWGIPAALLVVLLGAGVDALTPLPLVWRSAWSLLAAAAALIIAARMLRGALAARSRAQVALWIEERVPALRYALITALDPAAAPHAAALEAQAGPVPFEPVAWRAARRAVAVPAGFAAAGLLAVGLLPAGAVTRITEPRAGDALTRAAPAGNALAALAVTVVPPAYTGLPARTLDDPARVVALVGSRIGIEGRATGVAVTAGTDSQRVAVATTGDRWRATLAMPATPRLIRLHQADRERLLLLEPVIDSVPVVTLTTPERDTVLRAGTGTLPLAAGFRDDFGLAAAWWELVISSGEGENFKFRTLLLGRAGFGNAKAGARSLRLVLDSLALAPGDLVHLRAVAEDGNTITGPGTAGSDTRTLRIARTGEYDSLSIEALPPPDPLTGVISQRMLILLAEALEKRRPRIAHDVLMTEAGKIARDQNTLRRQVSDIIFARLDDSGSAAEHAHDEEQGKAGLSPEEMLKAAETATNKASGEALDFANGESPVVAINRPLLEAYNAMWDAGRALVQGETKAALPHMYAALAAIQRARLAERIYLRGPTKEAVVDLGKVRLVGKKEGIGPAGRSPRTAEDAALARQADRFDAALARLGADRAAAVDSLLLLRADLLGTAPAVAAPLGDAIDALRSGRDATAPLVAARRALGGASTASGGLPRWGLLP